MNIIQLKTVGGISASLWQLFVEAFEEFLNCFIQSKISASAYEYSESSRANKFVTLSRKGQGQTPRAQSCLALIPLTKDEMLGVDINVVTPHHYLVIAWLGNLPGKGCKIHKILAE